MATAGKPIPPRVVEALDAGWSVIPQLPTKTPYLAWKPYQDECPSREQVASWCTAYPDAHWAVVCGAVSGLIVFDFDGPEGLATLRSLGLAAHVETPGGGAHVYAEAPPWQIVGKARVDTARFPGLDLKTDGHLATFHGERDGRSYRAVRAGVLPFDQLAPPLIALCKERERTPARAPDVPENFDAFVAKDVLGDEAVQRVRSGARRNETGLWLACQLRDEGNNEDEALPVMSRYAEIIGNEGSHAYTQQEAYNSLRSAYSQPRRAPRALRAPDDFALTDLGNAERLVASHGRDLRYCHPWKTWLVWDTVRWRRDTNGAVERSAKTTVRAFKQQAEGLADPAQRKSRVGHAKRSESAGKLHAMIDLAQSETGMPVSPDELDTHPWLLNVANGTVDLRAGELRAHERADLITKLSPVLFDANAKSPRFDAFLERVMPDSEDRAFLRRAVGYSLTGAVSEQVLFVLYGTGANGKSVFLETMRSLLGDYAQHAPAELLLARRPGGASPDVARLAGMRFVAASESEEGARLAESAVKQLTGGDRITARNLYENLFEFAPTHKLWLATNHLPAIRGTDDAIWRRIRQIPFQVKIPEDDRDPDLA